MTMESNLPSGTGSSLHNTPRNSDNALRSPSPSHFPAHLYTNGVPSPPRILIPPPTIRTPCHPAGVPVTILGKPCHTYTQSHSTSPQLSLQELGLLLGGSNALQDWKYESRREAQRILPWVWLGPLSVSKNRQWLRERGVSLAIAVRNREMGKRGIGAGFGGEARDGIRYECIDVSDNLALISSFKHAARLVDRNYVSMIPELMRDTKVSERTEDTVDEEHVDYHKLVYDHQQLLRSHPKSSTLLDPPDHSAPLPQSPKFGSTLIFCETGNDRSAAVCAAYIMQHFGASVVQAIQIVQGRRFCVCFDDGIKNMLMAYDVIWRSEREVEQEARRERKLTLARQAAVSVEVEMTGLTENVRGFGARKNKRSLDEAYEDLMIEVGREGLRGGVAPFRDDDSVGPTDEMVLG